ncbi:uncharacterized protein LOC142060278 isoform X2 [Phalacrocorax aristotelis]|uniref:uncharacterized protein LOC142060278 isoform X2 n=1 Tax=Phalacrocorax aristotelis TaxID=126867 RepID=UPI003F4B888B
MRAGRRPRRPQRTAVSATRGDSPPVLSAPRPRPEGVHLNRKAAAGTAATAPGQPPPVHALGEKSPLLLQPREKTKQYSALTGVCLPSNSLSPPRPGGSAPLSAAQRARRGGGRAAAGQGSPRERSGGVGLSRRGRHFASLPASSQLVVQRACCSLRTPGRTRRPWPSGTSMFNGSRWKRKASDPGHLSAGSHRGSRGVLLPAAAHAAPGGDVPCAHRAPVSSRHSPLPARPGHLGSEKWAARCLPSTSRAPVATSRRRRRSPHPSRAASPSEVDPRQLRAADPPAALAAGAEGGLPAPSSGGEGAWAARAGRCRGEARRGPLPQAAANGAERKGGD